ncbi:MAG: McrC family protein [Cycloclasticus sp.]|nr:McrC family protein [Cycloclasticus sp.]
MITICVREYGVLFAAPRDMSESLSSRVIPKKDWDWLLKEASGTDKYKALVRPIKRDGFIGLQVLNYVGVITTPHGCQIEIVPKIDKYVIDGEGAGGQKEEAAKSRLKLAQMLSRIGLIKFRAFNHASLKVFDRPLPEVLIKQFLDDVTRLIKRGIRNDYVAVKDEATYLKGRLQIAAQIRQPVGRQHLFQIEYDEFLPDRAENRLIHSALLQVSKQTRNSKNKRLAQELLFVFDAIPVSSNYRLDFSRWLENDRSMIHYKPVKHWCDFILNEKTPFSLAGAHQGLSFLFPMNVLFEKYVAVVLKEQLKEGLRLKEQAASKFLVERHIDRCVFQLKPDLLILSAEKVLAVLDCKWKLINSKNREENYGISSSDMYQLFAYGKKYLGGKGDLFLIYPENEHFRHPLPVFDFDDDLSLWVVPLVWRDVKDSVLFNIESYDYLSNELVV